MNSCSPGTVLVNTHYLDPLRQLCYVPSGSVCLKFAVCNNSRIFLSGCGPWQRSICCVGKSEEE
jgi:hypothetical protein